MGKLLYGGKGYVLVEETYLDDPDEELYGKRAWFVRWEGGSRTGPFKSDVSAQEYANRNGGRWMRAEVVQGKKDGLDDLVRECTAFDSWAQMLTCMVENGYVPTLNGGARYAELAKTLRMWGFKVFRNGKVE